MFERSKMLWSALSALVLALGCGAESDKPETSSDTSDMNESTCEPGVLDHTGDGAKKVAKCIVKRDQPSKGNVEALANLFTDPNLDKTALAGATQAGDTAFDRFDWIVVEITQCQRGRGDQFCGGFNGDQGFSPYMQDGYLYQYRWGGGTNQTGHFLTGTTLTYTPELIRKLTLYFAPFSSEAPSKTVLRMIVGHEMLSDAGSSNFIDMATQQYEKATDEAIAKFLLAAEADRKGDSGARDALLVDILVLAGYDRNASQNSCPQTVCVSAKACEKCPWNMGNSLNDLRLSLKGFRLGQQIVRSREVAYNFTATGMGVRYEDSSRGINESPAKETGFATRQAAADWLRSNVGPSAK